MAIGRAMTSAQLFERIRDARSRFQETIGLSPTHVQIGGRWQDIVVLLVQDGPDPRWRYDAVRPLSVYGMELMTNPNVPFGDVLCLHNSSHPSGPPAPMPVKRPLRAISL